MTNDQEKIMNQHLESGKFGECLDYNRQTSERFKDLEESFLRMTRYSLQTLCQHMEECADLLEDLKRKDLADLLIQKSREINQIIKTELK